MHIAPHPVTDKKADERWQVQCILHAAPTANRMYKDLCPSLLVWSCPAVGHSWSSVVINPFESHCARALASAATTSLGLAISRMHARHTHIKLLGITRPPQQVVCVLHTPAGWHQRSLSLLIMLLCAAHVLASLGPVRLRQNTRVSLIHRSIRPFARVLKQRCLKRRRLFSSYYFTTLLVVVVVVVMMKSEQSGVTYLDQHQLCPFKQLHGCVTSASSQSLL